MVVIFPSWYGEMPRFWCHTVPMMWKKLFVFFLCRLCPCMYMNTYIPSDSVSASLPETRVHYCSLISASNLATAGLSIPVWPFFFFFFLCLSPLSAAYLWETVREACCYLAFECAVVSLVPPHSELCVRPCMCVCALSCWGYMCGAVCPQGLSPQWPQRRLSHKRDRERERKRERECLCCPFTAHTLIILS